MHDLVQSNYQLGLITLFDTSEKDSIEEIVKTLENSCGYFTLASREENRIDAVLFKLITKSIVHIIVKVIEPIFKSNFHSSLCKIDCLLREKDIDEHQTKFLKYLKDVIQGQSETETNEYNFFVKSIIKAFPHFSESKAHIFYDATKNCDMQTVASMLSQLNSNSGHNKLFECIMHSCVTLQGTPIYYEAKENPRNKFIAQLLGGFGFRAKDQIQWGLSNTSISTIRVLDVVSVVFRTHSLSPFASV